MNRDILRRFDRFLPRLRKTIGRERFLHSVGAMHYAVVLANRHGGDIVRAATAGLLHDCGRLRTVEEVDAEFKRRGLAVPEEDRDFPKIWHGFLSAYMAEHDHGIADEAVLRAIRLHSTGEADMSRLDKIIFLADYTEPMRCFAGLKELRETAERDLDCAFQRALESKFGHVQSQGRPLHPRSQRAFAATQA